MATLLADTVMMGIPTSARFFLKVACIPKVSLCQFSKNKGIWRLCLGMEYVGIMCTGINALKNSSTSISEWFSYHEMLDEKMQTLKRKMEALISHEMDVNEELRKAAFMFGKKPKRAVENWLKDVRCKTTDVQDIERKAGKKRCIWRSRFLRLVDKNIQEIIELIEQGRFSDGLLLDIYDQSGDALQIDAYGRKGDTLLTTPLESSIHKLQNDIANYIKLDLSNDDNQSKRAAKLFKALGRKKFILILDDMWTIFPPEEIGIPIGVNDGKLIITTRSLEVCRGMKCQERIKVMPLSEEEAWELFVKKLGSEKVLDPEVEEIAKSIAKECAGLPLAIITIARTMIVVDDIHDWRSALYELQEYVKGGLIDMEGQVFNLLKFSYDRLKDVILQQCLIYCALFPEDYKIPRVDLIVDWIAEGLIDERRTRKAKYDRGHAILNKLENVCLLENAVDDEGKMCVKMHDVIRDMALNITRENGFALFMVKAGMQLFEFPNDREWSENLERVSLMNNLIEGQVSSSMSPKCPKLRTLLLQYNEHITKIPNSFFERMQSLRVLDLSYLENLKHLPKSISNLKTLRGLLLNHCIDLTYVPSLTELSELMELDLQGSGVTTVPEGLEGLINLKRLDLCDASGIKTIPNGLLPSISHLQCLRLDNCLQVDIQMEELICLRQLEMLGIHFSNLQKFNSYVNTHHWQMLTHYRLQTGGQYTGDSLLCCRQVYIKGYNLCGREEQDNDIVLPTNMQVLEMINCYLPTSLSNLSHSLMKNASRGLEKCKLDECKGIQHLWSFTTTTTSSSVLQNLQTLVLVDLPNLTRLFKYKRVGIGGGPTPPTQSGIFSTLKLLNVRHCHNLKYLFAPCLVQHHLQNLQLIRVFHCSGMECIVTDKEEEEEEEGIANAEIPMITFPKLKYLELLCLPNLKSICFLFSTIYMNGDGQKSKTHPTLLHKITGEQEWWDLLEWDTTQARSLFNPLFSVPQDVYTMMKDDIWQTDLRCYEEVK
ncbi:hypothetical protein F0562_030630 [Nyssa sinensis]|uniref:Uncharacterized protein n=1 Tax=Nyssa sinensis TaxID=561372 RepID=A0A5J5B1F5_9ASTE|nr:hypothetical protein F0562_030630 [Nyssa sinensis]